MLRIQFTENKRVKRSCVAAERQTVDRPVQSLKDRFLRALGLAGVHASTNESIQNLVVQLHSGLHRGPDDNPTTHQQIVSVWSADKVCYGVTWVDVWNTGTGESVVGDDGEDSAE